jgi:hypothetical protein
MNISKADSVSNLHGSDSRSHFLDNSHALVAQCHFHTDEMLVGAADAGVGDSDDGLAIEELAVGGRLDNLSGCGTIVGCEGD